MAWRLDRQGVTAMAEAPQLEPPGTSAPLRKADDKGASRITSEIVIIDDDGTEEPFDARAWFS